MVKQANVTTTKILAISIAKNLFEILLLSQLIILYYTIHNTKRVKYYETQKHPMGAFVFWLLLSAGVQLRNSYNVILTEVRVHERFST